MHAMQLTIYYIIAVFKKNKYRHNLLKKHTFFLFIHKDIYNLLSKTKGKYFVTWVNIKMSCGTFVEETVR